MPKIQRMSSNNFYGKGSNLIKHFHVTRGEAGMRIWVQLFGGLHA